MKQKKQPPAGPELFYGANKLLSVAGPLGEKSAVQARFLLGPAGSGKTFRCLDEIRAALRENPNGPPLFLLAPKQATFQLERQLLGNAAISGYTRLQILSFERLARFVLEKCSIAPPRLLSDEGRVMVLRALLLRHGDELKLFRRSARRPGFAQNISALLNELSQHQLTPAGLRALIKHGELSAELRGKLQDLALLHEHYSDWLAANELQDASRLLDVATLALRANWVSHQTSTFNLAGLWLDGFAEMTPQELDLLTAILPQCKRATLAFCLDYSDSTENSWLSIWNTVGKTFQQCRQRIENLPDCEMEVEITKRDSSKSRFGKNFELAWLEENWAKPAPDSRLPSAITLRACANPEAEAVFAARQILKFVRPDRTGNRFRDCAVLVRNLENYRKPLARVFRRYGIPFFLDRRESVAHHALAELTRSALRTVAFDWQPNDWFAALKAGFAPVDETEIDRLENAALEFGWRGEKWREPLPDEFSERLRQKILPPFEHFSRQLGAFKNSPNGVQLAAGLRELWNDLNVERTLERWNLPESQNSLPIPRNSSLDSTVWEQMNSWLDNVALAFPRENLPLRDWLQILEAGLASLTVGVIPPVLDEVLVGAIDRARNPDLKLAFVLGLNEAVFPAAPSPPPILTDADRAQLGRGVPLGLDLRERLSRERFYGYIACTRASEKLALTFSRSDADGNVLNPSPFVAHLQMIFPRLAVENFSEDFEPAEAEHANELIPALVQIQNWKKLLELPALADLKESLDALREPDAHENLSAALAEKLFGRTLQTSVSRLEEFAQCPFKFFVRSGLRAGERKLFELDARERGSFQHEALKEFHKQLKNEDKHWRYLTPAEARGRIGVIAAGLSENFREGLLRDTAQTRFEARAMAASLQDFIEVMVTWMRGQYEFDPAAAELDFGGESACAPAWELDLDGGQRLALQGRIDRVDLCRESGDHARCVVMDYKSGGKKLDAILVEHGVQLQLPAYLNALRHWKNPREKFGVDQLIPAGVFYVNLRGQFESGKNRKEVLDADDARKRAYRHNGQFDAEALPKLDNIGAADQFSHRQKKPRAEFEAWLDAVETTLREMGRAIFSGIAKVDPYRKGGETPCENCDYRAACRIDPWTHRFRVLRAPPKDNPA